ncbi:proton pump-interactor BIP131-like [Typha angustifolia]|uniref:proton pump-interactor BIP131-like n=1 Tax=Typha angustifolia TaxID=59011 RepID=UPI003C2CCCD1
MGMEIIGADITQAQGPEESAKFGLVDNKNEPTGEVAGVDHVGTANFPKDAVDEWPEPKQIHTFYFVKFRSYEDPKMKVKIEQADKDIQKKNQNRYQITEALKAKRSERANVIAQLKPLSAENKQFNEAVNEKMKEMEPLQTALGKLRNANNAAREKGMGLCSSEEELNDLIKSLHYRISHESISLDEEKQLLREIKQLEGTRGKVIANSAMRAKIQDSVGQKEAIQDQVKLIGADIDGVRKERQAIRTRIKQLEDELKVIDADLSSLQEDLASVNEKKDKAFETINELRKSRDSMNTCYYQNRSMLNNAKELAAKKDVTALEGLSHSEVEKFMSQWSNSKAFREDYERRILSSLDNRQLSRDGRMRNPDEKPIILDSRPVTETAPVKVAPKQEKEVVKPVSRADTAPTDKVSDKEIVRTTEVELKGKQEYEDTANRIDTEKSEKKPSKSKEISAEKLKEMQREEEIAKAKLAMERKKKLAEKSAAKAAVRAQKEAEKKQKEKEKKAKKKAAASAPVASDEQVETDAKVGELTEADVTLEAPTQAKTKEPNDKVRSRNLPKKTHSQLPKVILKRKKSNPYWTWVAPAAILALVLVVFGYYYQFVRI